MSYFISQLYNEIRQKHKTACLWNLLTPQWTPTKMNLFKEWRNKYFCISCRTRICSWLQEFEINLLCEFYETKVSFLKYFIMFENVSLEAIFVSNGF